MQPGLEPGFSKSSGWMLLPLSYRLELCMALHDGAEMDTIQFQPDLRSRLYSRGSLNYWYQRNPSSFIMHMHLVSYLQSTYCIYKHTD